MVSAQVKLVLLYWLSTVFLTWDNIVQGKAIGEAYSSSGVHYLKQFGYLPEDKGGKAQAAQDISQSLRVFQTFAGLNVTGRFDEETVEKMKEPRCGDKDQLPTGGRRRRYVLEGSKWKKKDLTYRIENHPYDGPTNRKILTPELISKTIKAALQKWSFAADLVFEEIKEGEADIMIKFSAGEHGDNYGFDGRGKALAHAFYPNENTGYAGDVHFDSDEKFSLTEDESTNFIWVTTHEFGHSLGLRHSQDAGAIMYPWYQTGEMGDVRLSKDDKDGIRRLYGKSIGRNSESPIVLPLPPRKECHSAFDAVFHDKRHQRVYALREFEFYLMTRNGEHSKGPRRINKRWKGLNTKVRAAYTREDGYTIFFTRHRYYKYDGTRLVVGPLHIEEYGLSAELRDMDAAITYPGNGQTYFFKGDKYWKYDEENRKIFPDYPKLIKKHWHGVPDNIDAALQTPEGETYFFKGKNYYRISQGGRSKFQVYPGYPKPIGPHWLGCTDKESGVVTFSKDDKSAALGLRHSYIVIIVTALVRFALS
ncbi:matrix metalloproteinase-25-like [Dendronephthya gigantea]|uniref:matrix metalloproteinase-25-like n=1 Tax=Dendronephthya gigantea TaxID=151771 RepID=UPI00106BB177|nr:matrix metalloproteinase-25-like [Dendronephthya gigantea]